MLLLICAYTHTWLPGSDQSKQVAACQICSL